ncbi:sorbosone dehydrogenase family protein [Sphingomonas sp. HF-S4]|uniref:Sorbosone dehydrogenase family protein n=1 Tax=Sphingomonas agrestis TaxID=3080540 RepID=A0ABU3Y433_9SPHN|nr:sorbosone dehydrogenase family protein [Sphingomonas sp. HF-S4]MDV3455862.1 sorbosone dehydrogenase family protein [Sphingomonas sp. HF-S4]
MTIARWSSASALALLLAACGGGNAGRDTGPTPQLPAIQQNLVPTIKIASPAGWEGALPTVPEGFRIVPLATDLRIPRQMLVLPNGDLLVSEGRGGHAPKLRPKDVIAGYIKALGTSTVEGGDRLTLLRDADGDGRPEVRTVFIDGLDAPYGLAYVDGNIYVANQGALLRFPYSQGQTAIPRSAGVEVTALPSQVNHHWTKSLAASTDGDDLYVGIGSNSNIGERGMAVEEERAVILEIDRATGARRPYASGIRNPTALAINPWTNGLWAVVNERDEIGPHLVPDYLTSVQPGAFYGWPYSYWGKHGDPRVRPARPDMVARAIAPDYALGAHVAALGLAFVRSGAMAPGYGDGAFVGQHGSWNRSDLSGYKVTWVPFANGRPSGPQRDFVTGFLVDGKARGRPVGVAFSGAGRALYIADDLSNTVWRVTPAAGRPAGGVGTGAASTR